MSSKTALQHMTQREMPDLAALLALLADHPTIATTPTLTGAVDAIQGQFARVWESLEQAIDQG